VITPHIQVEDFLTVLLSVTRRPESPIHYLAAPTPPQTATNAAAPGRDVFKLLLRDRREPHRQLVDPLTSPLEITLLRGQQGTSLLDPWTSFDRIPHTFSRGERQGCSLA
jgi:hypothetical protein